GAQGSSGGSHHASVDGSSSLDNNDWKHWVVMQGTD
ncbi:hypothetical protein A2U01_0118023, partial [Trifolium medium]|nr:hypothetical protein [Trifolium medium]